MTSGFRAHEALAPALILVLAAFIATAGIATLPMDGHEAFVVQTTHEMQARNDWIVPWFNGEPRLNKPPLNYWLTGATAWAAGSLDNIEAWHGRLVSALAALVMALVTFFAAHMLYGRRVAVLSAFFLVTSLGFFNYSHDARPDMLYAALCTAGYVAFISAWKASSNKIRTSAVMLMWAAYALATLSKGPHMPAVYLVASLVFCRWLRIPGRETLRLFRPVAGLILSAAITLPWWYLVQHQLGGNGLHGTQLSGSLLTKVRFDHFYDLYYFYRPLLLVLPWLVFLPHTVLHFRNTQNHKDSDTLLVLYILIPALVLSFGSQERWFYMLPSLPPMLILLAAGADYMLVKRHAPHLAYRRLLYLCLAAGIAFTVAGHLRIGWSEERFEFQTLAQHALALQRPDTPVYTLRLYPDVFVYYLKPPVREEENMNAILKNLKDQGHAQALIIMPAPAVTEIPPGTPHKVIYTTRAEPRKALSLVFLNPAQ
jgi:4-amino-4-deoxy-L-arabinose transferase-like glycosyltransferase